LDTNNKSKKLKPNFASKIFNFKIILVVLLFATLMIKHYLTIHASPVKVPFVSTIVSPVNGSTSSVSNSRSYNNKLGKKEVTVLVNESVKTQQTIQAKKDYSKLEEELKSYVKNCQGTYGIYFEDISSGDNFGINENTPFVAASTIKLPLNYMLYKKAESGEINLNSTMQYLSSDYEEGTGTIQDCEEGTSFTLEKLSELSIRLSDNIATNMLFRVLGGSVYCRNYFKSIGGTAIDINQNVTSAKDMGIYSKLIYNFSKSNPYLGGKIVTNLENTIYNDRVVF